MPQEDDWSLRNLDVHKRIGTWDLRGNNIDIYIKVRLSFNWINYYCLSPQFQATSDGPPARE